MTEPPHPTHQLCVQCRKRPSPCSTICVSGRKLHQCYIQKGKGKVEKGKKKKKKGPAK